jgi:flagellar M-ring protein FliF
VIDALRPWLERFRALDMGRRVALVAVAALIVAGSVWAWARATAPEYALLFSSLESGDASRIVERLKASKVPFKLERGGTDIWVPASAVHETRLSLASEGLPNGGGSGFELFDQQRFGESEFSEQVKYHRALEGELSRTISHMAGVEHARVHLVLPSRGLFAASQENASASVVLRLKPGSQLAREQSRGIVHLVASSVRGLRVENVTLVDSSGRKLSGGDDESEVASTSLEFQRNLERAQERSIQQILDTTLGPGNSVVRVAASLSFSREELTEERFNPQETSPRSFQITEERDLNSMGTAGGIPGAVSTLEGNDPNLTNTASSGVLRRSETRNFEISKTVRRAVEPVGRLSRLSIAVVVDGTWQGEGSARTFVPRTAEELATIKNVVAAAAGVDEARGDRVSVECVPFAVTPTPAAPEPTRGIEALVREHGSYVGAAAVGLLLLVAFAIFLAKRRRRGAGVSIGLAPVAPTLHVEEAHEAPNASSVALTPAMAEAERLRELTAGIASSDPYLAARLVRAWLKEGPSGEEASS